MHVLLSNDDGIHAKGLFAFVKALKRRGYSVSTVAPLKEQSGAGQKITFLSPLRVQKVWKKGFFFGYGVSGSPADCVKLALKVLLKEKPTWVLSGINNGYNYGLNVYYSGTVAAAMEGVLQGIPAMAFSRSRREGEEDVDLFAEVACDVFEELTGVDWPYPPLLNVNLPERFPPRGIRFTCQSTSSLEEEYSVENASGEPIFWLYGGKPKRRVKDLSVDEGAVQAGYVSVTPLQVDRTDWKILKELNQCQEKR